MRLELHHSLSRLSTMDQTDLHWTGLRFYNIIIILVKIIFYQINTIERSARCQIGVNLDSHSFFKAPCY